MMPSAKANTNTLPDAPDTPDTRAHLGRLLKQALRDGWDKLGLVVGVSLTATVLLSVSLWLERLVPRAAPPWAHVLSVAVAMLVVLSLPLGGVFALAHQIATRDELSYGAFWRGAIKLYPHTLRLAVCDALILAALVINLNFYARLGNVAGMAAMLLCVYLLVLWALMALYHFPLLVAQQAGVFDEPDKPARRGTFAVLRRAFFLVLGRPVFALGLLAALLVLTALCSVTGVLLAVAWPALTALMLTLAVRALLVQYDVLPPPPPVQAVVPDEKFRIKAQSEIDRMNRISQDEQDLKTKG